MPPEYFPWSKQTLMDCISQQKKGNLPALDLELTAQCSGCNCIYCDSKPEVAEVIDFEEMRWSALQRLLEEAVPLGLKWVYTCGLGEPLEDGKFWNMLHFLSSHGIKLSMFSNGVFIQDIHVARELKASGVNIILKMDTFEERQFDKILGKPGAAQKIYAARDLLLEAGFAQGDGALTDLAFSIVPTSLSLDGIPDVVKFCEAHNIFVSIGELEQAGAVIFNNLSEHLSITESHVTDLKRLSDTYYRGCYMRPICPCILTGIHIDNRGNCIVDRVTGFNCKWFLLTEPDVHVVGDIYSTSASDLFERVKMYRANALVQNNKQIDDSFNVSYVFGGCGGNPRDIIRLAREEM